MECIVRAFLWEVYEKSKLQESRKAKEHTQADIQSSTSQTEQGNERANNLEST